MSDASHWFEECLRTLEALTALGAATRADLCGVVWTHGNGARFAMPPRCMLEVLGILRKSGYVDLKGTKYSLAKVYRPALPPDLRGFYRDVMGGIIITEVFSTSGRVHLYPKDDGAATGTPEITYAPALLYVAAARAQEARARAKVAGFEVKDEKPRPFGDRFETVVIGTRDWSQLKQLATLYADLSFTNR